jgi:DNA processing protein
MGGDPLTTPVKTTLPNGSVVDEDAAVVALLRALPAKMSRPQLLRDLFEAGSARDLWEDRHGSLLPMSGDFTDPLEVARRDVDQWRAQGLGITTVMSRDYPSRLLAVPQAPLILFYRGQLLPEDQGVAVVGSRAASTRGVSIAAHAAEVLARLDVSVVSGLAEGIDTAAHRAALAVGARTVAVLGTGARRAYPAANAALQEQIADQGLVLSQFWPDAGPTKQSFPIRNLTMSGYTLASLIVEASEHSGTRHQAFAAVDQGRALILTDMVVASTTWAAVLASRPNVFVARSTTELEDLLTRVIELRRADDADARLFAAT